jgi:hypothetical protein
MNQFFLIISLLAAAWMFVETKGINVDQPRSWSSIRANLFLLGVSIAAFLFMRWLCGFQGAAVFLIPVAILAKVFFVELSKPTPRSYLSTSAGYSPSPTPTAASRYALPPE